MSLMGQQMRTTQKPVRRAERVFAIAYATAALALSTPILEVRATEIDTTYGDEGFVQLGFFGDASISFGVIGGSGGELVMASVGSFDNIQRCTVAKLTVDGQLALEFGENGMYVSDLEANEDFNGCGAMVVDAQGNFYTVGYTYRDGVQWNVIMVVALTPTGQLLETFGNHGKVIIDLPTTTEDGAYALAIDDEGNLYLAGSVKQANEQYDALVIKLDSTGEFEPSFGEGGVTFLDWGGPWDTAVAISLDRFERPVVVGTTNYGAPSDLVATRLTALGDVDETFGTGGTTTVDINTYDDTTAMTLDGEDNIYTLVVSSTDAPGRDAVIVKLDASGSVATEFGENGVVRSALGRWGLSGGIAFGPDNNLYTSGQYWEPPVPQATMVQAIDPVDGTLVATFGNDGAFLHSFDPQFMPYAQFFDSRGRLYLAGGTSTHFAATRILSSALDTIFIDGFEL